MPVSRKRKLVVLLAAAAAAIAAADLVKRDHVDFDHDDVVVNLEKRRAECDRKFKGLTSGEFRNKYRLTKPVFHVLLALLLGSLTHGNCVLPAYLMLAMFLEHCASGKDERELCVDYGCHRSVVHRTIHKVPT